MKQIMDGNNAASRIAYLFSEMAFIYPITPSSPMASNMDNLSTKENYNLFHDKVQVMEMQSEKGAAGALHGSLLTGTLTTTFTSSQGLLLMLPNLYKIAGECLPAVIHVASRTVATHALSIFGDHSDIYAVRQTGFCMLASASPLESYHMAIIAHLASLKGSLPFIHFFDGFRTSHELNVVDTLNDEDLLHLVPKKELEEFKNRALNPLKPINYGMNQNEDVYFQTVEARSPLYDNMPDIVEDYMEKLNELAHTNYHPFTYYGCRDAENVIIAMGSVTDTISLVVDEEMKKGKKIGVISVHLYRPFSPKYLERVLPKTVKKVAVLDRTKEQGSEGEPLYLDVLSALKDKDITVVGGRFGLSSKDTTPKDIYAVYKMLENNPRNNFTIGIVDDVNKTSLETFPYNIDLHTKEIQIYGYGSDGMVSASKDILNIMGKTSYVQGYFSYDSKKSGGVTVSHLRLGENLIKAPYYVTNPDLIVVTKEEYFSQYTMLDNLKENGFLLINTSDKENILAKFTSKDLELITQKKIKVLMIDAYKIAEEHHLTGKISKIMEAVILKLLGKENVYEILSESIENKFMTKGEDIVKNNKEAVKDALNAVYKLDFKMVTSSKTPEEMQTIYEKITRRLGNTLTVSEMSKYRDGHCETGLTDKEKRSPSKIVSKWLSENCIGCGMCSLICPHAVIRPFLIKEDKGILDPVHKEYHYYVCISEKDCTGCGLCVSICPGKQGKKALFLGEKTTDESEKYFNYQNPKLYPKFTVKGSQLEEPKFAFSGACAGCGETAYIKLLTQLYKDELVIANATGCSSIYGGTFMSTPYKLPWANSLFEDNAEFAYGMHHSYKLKRNRLKKIILENKEKASPSLNNLYEEFLNNFNSFEKTLALKEAFLKEDIPEELKELIDYVPYRTVVALGGDGWAYDIGFDGIDHVLSSGENVKIMVLDTEVYSNTGGQMSKSSHIGAVCEFADEGKKVYKKDLFKIAMCYPNCYVASICLGANPMQAIKAMKEAMEHDGPSLILCYAPCIEHGIKGGMACSLEEEKLAVKVGYSLLMRYHPNEEKLYLDYKTPDFTKYHEFLENEVRYKALKIKNKEQAEILLQENAKASQKRFNYYKKLSED